MNEKYNVYLISDSTGETLDRIFLSLQSQFKNFEYEKKEFFFIRTEQQVDKIITVHSSLYNKTREGFLKKLIEMAPEGLTQVHLNKHLVASLLAEGPQLDRMKKQGPIRHLRFLEK